MDSGAAGEKVGSPVMATDEPRDEGAGVAMAQALG
jgi:hypothetical protein